MHHHHYNARKSVPCCCTQSFLVLVAAQSLQRSSVHRWLIELPVANILRDWSGNTELYNDAGTISGADTASQILERDLMMKGAFGLFSGYTRFKALVSLSLARWCVRVECRLLLLGFRVAAFILRCILRNCARCLEHSRRGTCEGDAEKFCRG